MHRSRPSVTRTCTVQFVDAAVELILATLELRYVKMMNHDVQRFPRWQMDSRNVLLPKIQPSLVPSAPSHAYKATPSPDLLRPSASLALAARTARSPSTARRPFARLINAPHNFVLPSTATSRAATTIQLEAFVRLSVESDIKWLGHRSRSANARDAPGHHSLPCASPFHVQNKDLFLMERSSAAMTHSSEERRADSSATTAISSSVQKTTSASSQHLMEAKECRSGPQDSPHVNQSSAPIFNHRRLVKWTAPRSQSGPTASSHVFLSTI